MTLPFRWAGVGLAVAILLVPPATAQLPALPEIPVPRHSPVADLPDAPLPRSAAADCLLIAALDPQNTFPPVAPRAPGPGVRPVLRASRGLPEVQPVCGTDQCTPAQAVMSCNPSSNAFMDTVHAQMASPLTPRGKALLAVRGTLDPFNLLTIAGTSAISIASNADSAYGPGFMGFAKLTGVTFTEDMTGEFFGTFLIPSLAHQDPHYHRLPNASLKRRIAHCVYQVVWTQGDDGRGMFNYATVVGSAASEAVNNLYVPYRDASFGAGAARYWTALATDPIGNFITEFVPDLAQRFNVRIVLLQRIVNRVAIEEGGG